MNTQYISNAQHYTQVLSRAAHVRESLWIGTADIKDLYITMESTPKPFLSLLADLLRRGVDVRMVHAKEPGPNFRADFDRYPILFTDLERVLCPRVHFKLMVFDGAEAYVGSANLTGAGMGMKGEGTRNFEAGILTDDPRIVNAAMSQFDAVWSGQMCCGCKRKAYCGDPIA